MKYYILFPTYQFSPCDNLPSGLMILFFLIQDQIGLESD